MQTHVLPSCYETGMVNERALQFKYASLTLCFWQFETTTLEIIVKNIAEVGATGRYITLPRWCADG